MGIVGVIVSVIVVIATPVKEKIVEYIGQWLIEIVIKPLGQLLIKKLVKPVIQWLGYLFRYSSNTENYGQFDRVSYLDYMTFESRMSTMMGFKEALRDANINMIGLWGMAGVGKSTLVREVAKQVKEEGLFDEVVIATVTQSPDFEQIQGEIADKLDLKLDKKTLSGNADLLKARLTKDNNKKKLVILDDIWEKLDLDKIGIPRQGCKVVVTSRKKDVLSSEMDTQKDFELQLLLKEEAWSLFEKMAGNSPKDPNLQSIAKEVSTECAGLPLALVTFAKALKNRSEPEWKNALQQLKTLPHGHQTTMPTMQKVIYLAIRLSYDCLESSEIQYLFLLCAQVGSRVLYLDLLKYCFGMHLFHDIGTLEETRNRVYSLVCRLKDSGLLLDCPHTRKYFDMHDLVRKVALLIAAEDQNALTLRDDDLIKWPEEESMKRFTTIVVRDRDIHELSYMLECPKLRFLCVIGEDCSSEISETFFEGMRNLEVLDLTKMRISSLPSSLNLLTNLKALCLYSCELGDITGIGKLKKLEILSLTGSMIEQLPREIGLLTHLRMLDLSKCTKLKVIPPNILSRLIQLEELYVGKSFTQWEVEGLNNERASLTELKHLSQLTTLEVHIPDVNILPKDLLFDKLKKYKIFIGDVWNWSGKNENSRSLKLKLNTSFQLERGIKMLLDGIEDLFLDELMGVKSIIYELDMNGFQQLKHLHVQNNAEIKYIINSRGLVIDVVFPALEIFSLKNMINLEEICHGQLPLTSFGNLTIVKVENCKKLKFVFSSFVAKGLQKLQELEIRECNIIGVIIMKEEDEIEATDMILFPLLRRLVLHCLPKLMSFLSTQNSFVIDAGEIIPKGELGFLMPILHEQVR